MPSAFLDGPPEVLRALRTKGWMELVAPDGRKYYFSTLTRRVQWTKPTSFVPLSAPKFPSKRHIVGSATVGTCVSLWVCTQMPPQRWALPGSCTPRATIRHTAACAQRCLCSRVWCSGRLLQTGCCGAWCDTSGKRKNARGHTLCHRCACLCPSRHVMWWRPSVPYLYESGSYFCVPVFACVEACTLCTKNGGGTHVMPVSFLHPLATVSRMLCLCGQVRHRHLVQVQRRHQAPLTSLAQRSWRRLRR